ncbi:MAG TPA: alpha/beta hydrolase [Puia sp.]|jgi:pimeloyl-ACP methyl ester carboxylesterase|nr:alpha/beta hydrolase [Puia sp.]
MKYYLVGLLFLLSLAASAQDRQTVPYGNNPAAGHYQTMSDGTKLYYETYGQGRPLVLLHGDLFGDISEYSNLIPSLQQNFKVIAVDVRGHAKSAIGKQPFTYQMLANDAISIIQQAAHDSVVLIGFSGGAVSSMLVTLQHPELVRKLVYIGGNQSAASEHPEVLRDLQNFNGDTVAKWDPNFVKTRKALMPEPNRWSDFVIYMRNAWLTRTRITDEQLRSIKCPVLVAGGDRDEHNPVSQFEDAYTHITHAELAIIPGSDHVVLYREPELMRKIIVKFLKAAP